MRPMSSAKAWIDRAVAAVDADRVTEELAALVGIPSVTGSESAVQEEVARRMERAGLGVRVLEVDPDRLAEDPDFPGSEVERDQLRVVAGHLNPGRDGRRLLLLGHVDVVPAGDPDTWTHPPFRPTIQNGLLYGRGACDMKGGVVAALEAVRAVSEAGVDLAGEVLVVTVPSEEDGGAGTLAAIRAGYTADMAVITEPTSLQVVVAHAGAITFRLQIPGKAAHASTRREGVSALDGLGVVLTALEEDEARRNAVETHPLMTALGLPYPTIVGKVNGGSWASTVMDSLVIEGRYGVRLGQSWQQAAEELRGALAPAWEAHPFLSRHPLRLEITGGRFETAELAPEHPLPVGLAAAAEWVTGSRPACVGVPYGADMRLLVNRGATPTVMYGPGDIRVAHAADEHVALEEVVTCARVLAAWLVDQLGTGEARAD